MLGKRRDPCRSLARRPFLHTVVHRLCVDGGQPSSTDGRTEAGPLRWRVRASSDEPSYMLPGVSSKRIRRTGAFWSVRGSGIQDLLGLTPRHDAAYRCLLYTSDAADE